MPDEQHPEKAPARVSAGGQNGGLLGSRLGQRGSASLVTVLVALAANLLVAVAKSVAAVITRSASLTAEAAHSWADTGNEVFLLVANRRAARPPDRAHPLGHGREAYVWSLFAVLEGTSFLRSVRQATPEAESLQRDLIEHVVATSDPTLRAVFVEDASALLGLLLAAAGLAAHQLSGSVTPDAVGSILIGLLLVVVAVGLINRNRQFLVGEEADPRVRRAVLQALLELPQVQRVTYLRLEVVGPRLISVIGDVDLAGDDVESNVAVRLRSLEALIDTSPA